MDLLHRLRHGLGAKLRERETIYALDRLYERRLADFGLTRGDVRPVARLAARLGPAEVPLSDILRQLSLARGTPAAVELPRVSREDIARYIKEGRRLRNEEIDKLLRSAGRGLARLAHALAEPVVAAARATGIPARVELALVRRREFVKVRAELRTYAGRELMADLRLAPSEIPEVAAEAADLRAYAFVRGRARPGEALVRQARPAGAGYAGG